jgi:hypothetical protein
METINKAKSFAPTDAMRNNARRGLALREKYNRGGLDASQAKSEGVGSGVARARDIINGNLSLDTVKRMYAFFSRHEKNYNPKKKEPDGGPTAGTIAWLLWGGSAGLAFARRVLKQEDILKSYIKDITDSEVNSEDILPGVKLPVTKAVDEELALLCNIENIEEPTKPYFLILDEMNLSHVERYFADFLSTMESGDSIPLHKIENDSLIVPSSIKLPKNLFIIGTVNIDETTYMFSPKVLDRANTIEFRLTEKDLEDFIVNDIKLDMDLLKHQGSNMSDGFMEMALKESDKNLKPSEADLKQFFSELKKSGAEFGYRTASEIGRLMYMLEALGESGDILLDVAIMQKLLPKLHGSRNKLTKVLPTLGGFCLADHSKIKEDYLDKFVGNNLTEEEFNTDPNIKYKISFEKICRMYKNAVENGFASYAEA